MIRGTCVYCGRSTYHEARACASHRDLIVLDPHTRDADETRPVGTHAVASSTVRKED